MVFLEDTPLKEYSVEVVRKFLKETFSLKLNRVPGSNSEFFIRIFTRNSEGQTAYDQRRGRLFNV